MALILSHLTNGAGAVMSKQTLISGRLTLHFCLPKIERITLQSSSSGGGRIKNCAKEWKWTLWWARAILTGNVRICSHPISCVAGLPQVASERMLQLTTNADWTWWYTQRCINIEQTFIIYTLVLYMMYHCRLIWLNVDYVLITIPLKKNKERK